MTSASTPELEVLKLRLKPLYSRLAAHPLYRSFHSVQDLRIFMESHVYAVWDFMSLLKTLQRGLTCVETPWLPTGDASSRRLINEIVMGEESDEYEGEPVSHFELYLRAMQSCGAKTDGIDHFVSVLRQGKSVPQAMEAAGASRAAQTFVATTFRVIGTGKLHAIAAAFTFGREDLIPDIFRGFLRDQDARLNGQLSLFSWYLDRHIEVDGDQHGPMALQMLGNLCGNDERKWQEAEQAAAEAVEARIAFWDGILAALEKVSSETIGRDESEPRKG